MKVSDAESHEYNTDDVPRTVIFKLLNKSVKVTSNVSTVGSWKRGRMLLVNQSEVVCKQAKDFTGAARLRV